jgi:uncharacterized protein YjbI with pentapeptide repeats
MKIVKPDNLALLTAPCRMDGKLYLSIAALACFSLDAPGTQRILPEDDLWPTAMAALQDGDVLDQGYPKPGAEFIVHAAACAPRPTAGMEITARVGNRSKTLMVTGDRCWTATGAPGVPAPFARMPVTYRNAFGGPGYAFNPAGKGFRASPDGLHPLPNIQYPGKPVTSPKETPLPAGFSPYPASWPQRYALLGRFDAAWLAERWPDLPRDASADYFHTAPEDQRLQGFFQGDEEILLAGMHPEKSTIVSSLPGLRARIFVEQAQGEKKVFSEVQNRAETLMLYPEALRGILLFRGVVPSADEQLDDITCLTAAWETRTEAAQPQEKYFECMQAALNPPPAPDVESPPAPEIEATAETPAAAPPPPSPDFEALNRDLAAMEAESDQRLRALGMSREELVQKYGAETGEQETVSLESLTKEIEQLEKTTDERLQALGMGREALISKYGPMESAAAPPDPATLQGQVKELLAQSMGQLAAAKLTDADPWHSLPKEIQGDMPSAAEVEEALGLWEQQTPPAEEKGEPGDTPGPGTTALSAAETMERHRAGASLRGIDASAGDFSGCDLQGADFTEALLDQARFTGANLAGAVFTAAVLRAADFKGADLTGAVLQGATGPEADFREAQLVRADLSAGDWTGANLARADLHAANLSRAILRKADLTACTLQGAVARETDFSDGNLSGADFRGCDLTGADCSGANLTQAVLADVRAHGLQLFGAVAEKTDFRNASLRGARGGAGTLLTGAHLTGADLSEASLGGTQFIDTDLEGAALDGGDFSRTLFERSRLLNVTARGSSFLKAVFREADLRGIDLLQGSLRNARLEKVDLREASLYGVDFFGASLNATDTRGANLKGTLLTLTSKS